MKTLKFTSHIQASRKKVWDVLWNDTTYRKWTSAFCEGSYALSDWNEGSKIRFLSPDGDGMFSIIEKKIPYEQMVFKHLGEIKEGKETMSDWAGALERYELKESEGITQLNVEVDSNEEFEAHFKDTFPKALELLKQLSEQ